MARATSSFPLPVSPSTNTGTAAVAFAPHGIRVVGVGPGTILTEMVEGSFIDSPATERMILQFGTTEAASAHLAHLHPMGNLGLPQNIADAIGFLASSKASFMTGADMLVDGGYTAR